MVRSSRLRGVSLLVPSERLGELVESEDERVAAVACNAILDRAFGKPRPHQPEEKDDLVSRLERMSDEERLEEAREILEQFHAALARHRASQDWEE